MIEKYARVFILVIVLVGFFLRTWGIGNNPPSLTWDEAAWGYNAYTIGIDGRDEFGKFLPLQYLESFGDFKPPLYVYLAVIPVKLFGLTEFATRFPSAFFGSLTILMTYLLAKRIFNGAKQREYYALLAAFLLAISPWHINLSRAAFEANVSQFFIITGVWLFLRGIQEKSWSILLSFIFFALSLYTFNTARVFVPIFGFVLVLKYWKKLLHMRRKVLGAFFVGIVISLPVLVFLTTPQAKLRYHEVNIFSDISIVQRANVLIASNNNVWWANILDNRRVLYAREYLKHYLDHFNPDFLFIKGDGNPKFSTQDVGQLYLWELPFLIIGILHLCRRREGEWWIIPVWLLLGIAPAATARETPHALRIETVLPTFQIISAYGFVNGILYLCKRVSGYYFLKQAIVFVVSIMLLLNVLYYLHGYYTHYPREYSGEWQYGYKDSVGFVNSVENNYQQIFITSELGRPYIYYLFYQKIDPKIFRETAVVKREELGFVTIDGFGKEGKYVFRKDIQSNGAKKSLFIETPSNVPSNVNILRKFYSLDGREVLVSYER